MSPSPQVDNVKGFEAPQPSARFIGLGDVRSRLGDGDVTAGVAIVVVDVVVTVVVVTEVVDVDVTVVVGDS